MSALNIDAEVPADQNLDDFSFHRDQIVSRHSFTFRKTARPLKRDDQVTPKQQDLECCEAEGVLSNARCENDGNRSGRDNISESVGARPSIASPSRMRTWLLLDYLHPPAG
jgi:hypothetical protein